MGSETELKFRVFEKDPGEIIDAILKDSEIISKETHKLTNEYYDTEDLQLMRSRSGFRVRSTDGVYEETVKTSGRSGGGLATRKEFNIPLKDPRPDLSLFPPEAFPFETENLEEVSKGLKKLFLPAFLPSRITRRVVSSHCVQPVSFRSSAMCSDTWQNWSLEKRMTQLDMVCRENAVPRRPSSASCL